MNTAISTHNLPAFVVTFANAVLDELIARDDTDGNDSDVITYCELARQAARDFAATGNKSDLQAMCANAERAARLHYGYNDRQYALTCELLGV